MTNSILLFILLFILSVTLAQDVLPAQPTLSDTDEYIIVFKPNIKKKRITSQIQLINAHLVDTSIGGNSTVSAKKTKKKNLGLSTIGGFRWLAGRFNSSVVEALINTTNTSTPVNKTIDDSNEEDPIHYWVKDTSFSLQEFIQSNPPSWGLDRIDQRTGKDGQYRFSSGKGRNVKVYILDSGIRKDHEDIAGRVTIGKTVVGDPDDPNDYNGHGTFVAGVCCGTKYGVAKSAEVVSVKILDNNGNGRLSDVLTGLQWIVEQHVSDPNSKTIVNLSIGAFYSQATNDAIQQSIDLGIHFVIAAGNYGEDACLYSPGSTPGAVTVGAIDEDDTVSYYSNFGKCVDIFAPGTNIKSIWHTSKTETRVLTGTSMAAPHVAGAMAIYLSQGDYTPLELMEHLKNTSTLITENFIINNTEPYFNENKSVVDNAINFGYKVDGKQDKKTAVNILFSYSNDSQQAWIYGGNAKSEGSVTSTLCFSLKTLSIFTLIVVSSFVL